MATDLVFLDSKDFKKQLTEDSSDLSNIGIRKHFVPDEVKQEGDDDDRTLSFIISTGAVDRDRDTIDPKGWDIKSYRKNPIVLFAHDGSRPPIGRAKSITKSDDTLVATAEFMDNDIDTSGFSDSIFRMLKAGFLKATSVGFVPKEFEFVDAEEEPDRKFGIDFTKQELLEFSIVPVPSNPEALIQARSKGIDVAPLHDWYEEALDSWANYKNLLLIPRDLVEKAAKASEKKKRTRVYNISKEEQEELAKKNLAAIRARKEREEEELVQNDDIPEKDTTTDEILDTKSSQQEGDAPIEDTTDDADTKSVEKDTGADDVVDTESDSDDIGSDSVDEVGEKDKESEEESEEDESEAPMQLKLTSDGTATGTILVNEKTGEKIGGVRSITWQCSVDDPVAKALIEVDLMGVDITLSTDKFDMARTDDLIDDNHEESTDNIEKEAESDSEDDEGIIFEDFDLNLEASVEVELDEPEDEKSVEDSAEDDESEDELDPDDMVLEAGIDPDELKALVKDVLSDVISDAMSSELNRQTGKLD